MDRGAGTRADGVAVPGVRDNQSPRKCRNSGIYACLRSAGDSGLAGCGLGICCRALLLVGLYIRPVSLLLAGWCVLTAAIFHTKFSDLDQLMNFFKNVTMAGGFLIFAMAGASGASIDAMLALRRPTAR